MAQIMLLGDTEDEHFVGDPLCDEGWCDGGVSWPIRCEESDDQGANCPGLVHASFGDEEWDGYYLITKCDVCGEPY